MSETIKLESVHRSSNVAAVGYDAGTKTLAVRFHDGGTYHYQDVPAEKYEALKEAKSKGAYLHREIRPSHKAVKQ